MALLSLDVGFSHCGWVVFKDGEPQDCGVIKTEKSNRKSTRTSDDNAFRAAQVARQLKEIIEGYGIKGVIGELPSGGAQSANAMRHMALATGIVASVASVLELPVEWVSPGDLKKAVTGYRSASKDEVMKVVRKRFNGFIWPKAKTRYEHIADAAGAYLALQDGNLVKLFG
jgi:Holliday junction resolvasome RuvABC endonuclease subunit